MINITAASKTEPIVESCESLELMRNHQSSFGVNKSGLLRFVNHRRFALEKVGTSQVRRFNGNPPSVVDIAEKILDRIGYRFRNRVKHWRFYQPQSISSGRGR